MLRRFIRSSLLSGAQFSRRFSEKPVKWPSLRRSRTVAAKFARALMDHMVSTDPFSIIVPRASVSIGVC